MVEIRLRPIQVRDLKLLLAWRSNPRIYKNFREQEGPLSWEEHLTWFVTRSDERRDLVIQYNGRRVGVVAITAEREISIYVGEIALWGEGIATAALEEVTQRFDKQLTARIYRENKSSQRLFERCGFEQVDEGEWLRYRFEG